MSLRDLSYAARYTPFLSVTIALIPVVTLPLVRSLPLNLCLCAIFAILHCV